MNERSRKSRNITIKDVAREAGVSYSTVSRVVNGYQHVKLDKRQRVLAAIEQLGYVVNAQARSLAGGRSNVVGLLIHDLGRPYAAQIIQGVDEELEIRNYDLMLYTTHRKKSKEVVYVNNLTHGLIDGLLLSLPLSPGDYIAQLWSEHFPYVVIDHQGFDEFSSTVTATNWQGTYEAMNYLIDLGHRRIGFLAGTPGLSSASDRLAAYQAALAAYDIPFDPTLVENGQFEQHTGFRAANALLDLPEPPTAIFAANDQSAMGAYDAIRNRGLRIPKDISVMGFDDISQAAYLYPPLTTVRQPLVEMGRTATRMLLDRINDPDRPTERVLLKTELIIRESCQRVSP